MTQYKKFVATAATATLVASAIVPVASAAGFTDVENNGHAQAINALADQGIINGYPDGTFKPNKELTRSDVVKLLGKYLVSKGYKVPADAKTKQRFNDVPVNYKDQELVEYAALVKDAGVFQGSNNNLNAANKITRGQMALVVVRALDALNDTDLVSFVAEQDFEREVIDLDSASKEQQGAIDVLDFFDITKTPNYNPKSSTTRGQFASFLYRAINVELEVPDVELEVKNVEVVDAKTLNVTLSDNTSHVVTLAKALEANKETKVSFTIDGNEYSATVTYEVETLKVEKVKAINAKTLEVKFNVAVEDTSKAAIEVLRGTTKQNVTVTWAEDKKSVQLSTVSNLQAADYTVNISGLSDEKLTGKVTVEAQKVSSIEILDDVAVVSKNAVDGKFDETTTATVGYVVKDQYGTDITKTVTTLKSNDDSTIALDKGVITLSGKAVEGKKEGDLVPVVLVDTTTGVSVTKTVKLSAASTVSSIEVDGVYNAKGEKLALTDASKANDAFIVLDLKDQYGKEITKKDKAVGLLITNTNEQNISLDNKVTEQEIDGKTKLVIAISEIKKAGNTDILLISTTNGVSAKYTIKVAETASADAISVAQPEIAVANEKTLIPITVTDKSGNVITDKKLLANSTKGIKVSNVELSEKSFEVKDGQVYFVHEFTKAEKTPLVFQTSTYKTATLTVDVKEEAKPAVITKVKAPIVISLAKETETLTAQNHFIIEDQYGRVIENSNADIVVSKANADGKVVAVDENNTVTAKEKGSETLIVKLKNEYNKVDSSLEVKVQVTDGNEYSSYEVKELGLVKADDDNSYDLSVYGVLNGGKVALTKKEYTATISGGQKDNNGEFIATVKDGKISIPKAALNLDDNDDSVDTKFTVKVTIEATGEVLEQKFTASAKPAVVEDFFFTTTEAAEEYETAKAITEATLTSGTVATALKAGEDNKVTVNIATMDQYGAKAVEEFAASTITVKPTKVGDVQISGNGTAAPTITLNGGLDKATVTLKVTVGNATKEITVTVVPSK